MAELKDNEEPTFTSKRKPEDTEDVSKKIPKPAIDQTLQPSLASNNYSNSEKTESDVALNDDDDVVDEDADDEDEDGDEDEDEDDNDDDDDEEESNEVDRKGKKVIRDIKGKGKLIEEEEDDSDDNDDDSGGGLSGDDSDFSDDPLAEVDLNNILPSRTRRRTAHPGVHIAGDRGNADVDDDDSDDSDA
ncbi:hypothetical protein TanjilG_14066 [Lupinus angustifolius]|uniref:Histone chaperone domain-containing protein n=1 Tax=Lupinus angustifolius TaxID=3871 RepID=A0A1J7HHX9_LUPAN|nr:PREDICTED: prostatic spermine-binding protein [Lupinus angustifolius]OIW01977.1 hypothetical protein TanjilG_14066 [Lupinus angustifolius]